MPEPLTRTELREKYSDENWQRRLIDLISLVGVLRECIIDPTYRPTKALVDAIKLTREGNKLKQQLITQEGVHALDAPVLVFLSLVHVTPLIDVESIDMVAVETALSAEIKDQSLRFPLIFGRDLYDRAADLFKEERDYLKTKDTNLLLEDSEPGVFQAGHYLVGPFGLIRRSYRRGLSPTTAIPLQHCADPGCNVVHRVQLSTSQEAGVNKGRPAVSKLLDQISEEPSEWNEFIGDITEGDRNRYQIDSHIGVSWLVGDCFDLEELMILADRARGATGGRFVQSLQDLGLNPSRETIWGLTRAQLLQALLMLDDADITRSIEAALQVGDSNADGQDRISIPAGEVRKPMVNRHARVGAWRLRTELSRFGVRVAGGHPNLPLLRLEELVRQVHDLDDEVVRSDLLWVIGAGKDDDVEVSINGFLKNTAPAQIIETILLSRRRAMETACARLGVQPSNDRPYLRDVILWKLGFPMPVSNDLRDEYWRHHHQLESAIRTAAVNPGQSAGGLRSDASDYFVSLERYLNDALIYSAWALLEDHYASDVSFGFVSSRAQEFALKALNESELNGEPEVPADPVLSQIVLGFSRLSSKLKNIRLNAHKFKRPEVQYPKYAKRTQLQKFPFEHTHVFLDLTESSQELLIDVLAKVSSELNQSGIMTARNGLLHARKRVPTVGEVQQSLLNARLAIERLESAGLVRATYSLGGIQADAWGRSQTTLVSGDMQMTFESPSAYDWVNLPSVTKPIYLMQGAVFSAPGEMLRFSYRPESRYADLWRDFPRRPVPGNRAVAGENAPAGAAIDAGSFVSARD